MRLFRRLSSAFGSHFEREDAENFKQLSETVRSIAYRHLEVEKTARPTSSRKCPKGESNRIIGFELVAIQKNMVVTDAHVGSLPVAADSIEYGTIMMNRADRSVAFTAR
jgi:hypothetical protein